MAAAELRAPPQVDWVSDCTAEFAVWVTDPGVRLYSTHSRVVDGGLWCVDVCTLRRDARGVLAVCAGGAGERAQASATHKLTARAISYD